MATTRFTSHDHEIDILYKELADRDLQPLWELPELLTATPRPRAVPYVWRSAELLPLAARSGQLIPVHRGGDRRVLSCCNPGLGGAPYAVDTLWAAVQYLIAGEVAPAHRHSPGALRFVIEGSGVWTLVDGDAIPMAAGDLVLTPSWTFHEHHNSGADPMTWLDVLDLPMAEALAAVFFERSPSDQADARSPEVSSSELRYGAAAGLLPAGPTARGSAHSALLAYRWADTDRALRAQLAANAPYAHLRFADPVTGRDVMPTIRCEMVRVQAGGTLPARRQTGARVGCLLHGQGVARIGDQEFRVGPGDILAIPSWHPFALDAVAEVDLFVSSDAPVLDALHLYREQEAE